MNLRPIKPPPHRSADRLTAANHIHTCCFQFSFHSNGPYTTIYNRFIAGPSEDDVPAEKGGAQSSNRPLACRPHEETPYAERSLCRPVVLHLAGGQDADIAAAPDVLALAPPMSALLA
ncbi:hypothetical protein ACVWWI_006236 [Bradyrhizobium sp. USDA 3686]|nr:hypothetical protein [Bradyrhizobium canariense]